MFLLLDVGSLLLLSIAKAQVIYEYIYHPSHSSSESLDPVFFDAASLKGVRERMLVVDDLVVVPFNPEGDELRELRGVVVDCCCCKEEMVELKKSSSWLFWGVDLPERVSKLL